MALGGVWHIKRIFRLLMVSINYLTIRKVMRKGIERGKRKLRRGHTVNGNEEEKKGERRRRRIIKEVEEEKDE